MAINPLNDEHLQMMQALINQTPEALEYFSKCAECGMDAAKSIEQCQATHQFCQTVIKNFFPEHSQS